MNKSKLLIIISILTLLVTVAWIDPPGDASSFPAPAWDGPALGGEWLYDAQAGNWWYLHSIPEFDAHPDQCNDCHVGVYSAFTRLCPEPGMDCRLIVDGDRLFWDCTGGSEL